MSDNLKALLIASAAIMSLGILLKRVGDIHAQMCIDRTSLENAIRQDEKSRTDQLHVLNDIKECVMKIHYEIHSRRFNEERVHNPF